MRPFQRFGKILSRVRDVLAHPDFSGAETAEDVFDIMTRKSIEHHPANDSQPGHFSGDENFPKASDLLLEAEIRAVWQKVYHAKTQEEQLAHWNDYVNLINSRSEEQVERMEVEQGLR